MDKSPALQEMLGVLRAIHLFARNYVQSAPRISDDEGAIVTAFHRIDEMIKREMQSSIEELYVPRDPQREQFIQDEIARLERADWHEAFVLRK